MWNGCNCAVVWTFFGIALLWYWNENWPFPVLWPLLSFPNFPGGDWEWLFFSRCALWTKISYHSHLGDCWNLRLHPRPTKVESAKSLGPSDAHESLESHDSAMRLFWVLFWHHHPGKLLSSFETVTLCKTRIVIPLWQGYWEEETVTFRQSTNPVPRTW